MGIALRAVPWMRKPPPSSASIPRPRMNTRLGALMTKSSAGGRPGVAGGPDMPASREAWLG